LYGRKIVAKDCELIPKNNSKTAGRIFNSKKTGIRISPENNVL
jgi:hypothetical protein